MRIAFVLDRTRLGGAERHTLALARALAVAGHAVEVIVLMRGGSINFPAGMGPRPLKNLGARSAFSPSTLRALGDAITQIDADLVFAVNQTALTATWLARALGLHQAVTVCIFHTTLIRTQIGRAKARVFAFCVRRSDAIVYVSENQKRYWEGQGLRCPVSVAIPNGIDAERFSPQSAQTRLEARDRYGFNTTDVVVALCARFAPEKNHAQLIEALARMGPRPSGYKLMLIGDGQTRPKIEALAANLGVAADVVFTGEQSDVRAALAAADVGVLVSTAVETFSLAALELMASGLPVVLSDIGGASEMVTDGENGLLFPAGDTDALIAALWKLKAPGARERMGAAARRRVVGHYTESVMVEAYDDFVRRTGAKGWIGP